MGCLVGRVDLCNGTLSSKVAVTNQVTINNSNKIWYTWADFCVVDKVVYMGTVNNFNKTWQGVICAVHNNNYKLEVKYHNSYTTLTGIFW